MLILRAADYRTVPWKNGGGITREILREPAEPAPFDWRLSLATIDSPGPFSSFEGYERTLILVQGAGVELEFGAHGSSRLSKVGQKVCFDGAWTTHCNLLAGRSTDLNLIVSQERMYSTSDSVHLTQVQLVQAAQWTHTLLCCISGRVRLTNSAGADAELNSVDVARCSADDGAITCSPLGSPPVQLFVAGLSYR